MQPHSKEFLEQHNQQQLKYFEIDKKTMQPADGTTYINRQIDELLSFAAIQPEQALLDVGCGIGRYTLPLARRGYQVTGLDLSQHLLDQLREHDAGEFNIPLFCADVLYPPEELIGQFDVVIGFFTLHHLHDIPGCLRAMTRFLRPRGKIIFLEPNAYNPLYYLQILLTPNMTWEGDGGLIYMRSNYIFKAMSAAGLEQPQVKRFGFAPPFIVNHPIGAKIDRALERFPLWRPCLPFQLFMGTVNR